MISQDHIIIRGLRQNNLKNVSMLFGSEFV